MNIFSLCLETEKRSNSLKKWLYSRDFVVFLFLDTFWIQKCLETEKRPNSLKKIIVFKGFYRFPVSRHFLDSKVARNRKRTKFLEQNNNIQGILSFFLFLVAFWIKKCQETGKLPNPLKKSSFSRELEHGTWYRLEGWKAVISVPSRNEAW